jgi:hypothetical protein
MAEIRGRRPDHRITPEIPAGEEVDYKKETRKE